MSKWKLSLGLGLVLIPSIFATEPPEPSRLHLIDRNRTNTPPTYRVSVDYDVYRVSITYHVVRREPMRYDYRIALKPSGSN